MKRLSLLTATAALLLWASCSDSSYEITPPTDSTTLSEDAINFTTSLAKSKQTRGGAYGSIDDTKLKTNTFGFGVFAYYTGKTAYSGYRTQNADDTDRFPNFMYNEKVTFSAGKWGYEDIKYWPNERVGTDGESVDDQNNDSSNDPAQGKAAAGGKVSFFAYAPYAAFTLIDGNGAISGQAITDGNDGSTSGIVAISGNKFNGGKSDATDDAEKYKYSDPYIKYVISTDNDKQVDLLWGTTGNNGVNVVGNAQNGVDASSYADVDKTGAAIATRPAYNVNADLTKQTTNGTVDFLFKHALAKIGGSYVGSGDGSDDDPQTPTNGLMVVLDIDNNGAETGGSLQAYKGELTSAEYTTVSGDADKKAALVSELGASAWTDIDTYVKYQDFLHKNTKNNTKVTINEIVISNEKELTADGKTAIEGNGTFDYTSGTYTTNLKNTGLFNLVTGVWSDQASSGTTTRSQTIVPATGTPATDDAKDAILAEEVAEPNGFTTGSPRTNRTKAGFESLPIGVTTVAKNVYESEAQPFVFIPGTYPIITFTITYTVRTYDPNLAYKYSEVKQKITKRLYILDEIKLNQQYNILMHLGLTSVKFTASVSDWDVAGDDVTGKTDGTGSEVLTADEEVEHVYLPMNVGSIALATSTLKTTFGSSESGSAIVATGETKYYKTNTNTGKSEEVTIDPTSDAKFSWVTDPTSVPTGFTVPTSADKSTITVAANTTYADRSVKVRGKYTDGESIVYSDWIEIMQYGRFVSGADVTWADGANFEPSNAESTITYTAIAPTAVYETDVKGHPTGDPIAPTPSFSNSDYEFVFMDGTNVADWVSCANGTKTITVTANGTGSARSAKVYVKINGKLFDTGKTISQAA